MSEQTQIDRVRGKVAQMQNELSAILDQLSEYENTKCPDKGDSIITQIMADFENVEAHANQSVYWAQMI